ncbi:hypothetical protein [Undibacterium baiyunense]|uniref:Uncharacterized protein n=1 Tax=Undibacterium baiyunense TaxID=2828731 RepID=A0A941DHT2_9BURK|nr:hypothetical protein [Undibacterium baiyunense]MBR7747152.1 hypothetical protein [Undibacterium baiyunense]
MRSLLFFAPIPAVLMSIVLMQFVGVSRFVWIQQVVVSVFALGLAYAMSRRNFVAVSTKWHIYLVLFLGLLLFLPPVLGSSPDPQRWLVLGGFRLYIAACVLPLLVLLLENLIHQRNTQAQIWIFFYPVIAAALAWQPDASQSLAVALIGLISIMRTDNRTVIKLMCIITLLVASILSSAQPDPLKPVSYVEGVIQLGATMHLSIAAILLLVLAIIPISLIWIGRRHQHTTFYLPALYYLVIDICAFLQLTPMPLLGFGAGPILGYALMAYACSRQIQQR